MSFVSLAKKKAKARKDSKIRKSGIKAQYFIIKYLKIECWVLLSQFCFMA